MTHQSLITTIVNSAENPSPTDLIWDALLDSSYSGISGSDITCSAMWKHAVTEGLLTDKELHYLTIADNNQTSGVFAYFCEFSHLNRKLKALTETFAGRSNFLVQSGSFELCSKLLQLFGKKIHGWDTLQLTLVDSCTGHIALHSESKKGRILAHCMNTAESPYIELGGSWDQTFNSLPKKLRWTIRKAEKDLNAIGTLAYEEYSKTTQIDKLLHAIYEIERSSWKEQSGTSITTQEKQKVFYDVLTRRAAQSGKLSAHVLTLDNKPIAYILGLVSGDGSFLDLKESFVESHSQYSPAHVLKRFTFPTLIAKGVRIYDFMGVCEPYKMRWTDKTYQRHTVVIYNKTLRGRLAYLKSMLGKNSAPVPAPAIIKQAPQETDW